MRRAHIMSALGWGLAPPKVCTMGGCLNFSIADKGKGEEVQKFRTFCVCHMREVERDRDHAIPQPHCNLAVRRRVSGSLLYDAIL